MNSLRCLILLLSLLVAGCDQGQKPVQQPKDELPKRAEVQVHRSGTPVVVPDFVAGRWKAVKIEVRGKDGDARQLFEVPIGGEFSPSDSDLKVRVEHFLPHFVMDGKQLTSKSNNPVNPAVNVRIYEAGQEVFDGWLFAKYPNTHPFKHPRFSFALVGYVRSDEKGVDN